MQMQKHSCKNIGTIKFRFNIILLSHWVARLAVNADLFPNLHGGRCLSDWPGPSEGWRWRPSDRLTVSVLHAREVGDTFDEI